jgi:hypothetical protein
MSYESSSEAAAFIGSTLLNAKLANASPRTVLARVILGQAKGTERRASRSLHLRRLSRAKHKKRQDRLLHADGPATGRAWNDLGHIALHHRITSMLVSLSGWREANEQVLRQDAIHSELCVGKVTFM